VGWAGGGHWGGRTERDACLPHLRHVNLVHHMPCHLASPLRPPHLPTIFVAQLLALTYRAAMYMSTPFPHRHNIPTLRAVTTQFCRGRRTTARTRGRGLPRAGRHMGAIVAMPFLLVSRRWTRQFSRSCLDAATSTAFASFHPHTDMPFWCLTWLCWLRSTFPLYY